MKPLVFAFTLLVTIQVYAQFDTINQFNAKGKKDGYWKLFLDSTLHVTDSANSFFIGYDYCDDGEQVFSYKVLWDWRKRYRMEYIDVMPEKGKPVPLNGTFRYFQGDSQVVNLEIYKDGRPLFWEAYSYFKTDSIHPSFVETIYFDKLYMNMTGSYYYTETSYYPGAPTQITEYWFRKGKKGWKTYKVK